MSGKRTSGPWRWLSGESLVGDHSHRPVVLTARDLRMRNEEGRLVPNNPDGADARLIEAAPDLLAALEAVAALAIECDRCAGTGRDPSSSEEFPDACHRCAGVGEYVPTAGPELTAIRKALAKAGVR